MLPWIAANGGLVGLGVTLTKYALIAFSIASLAVIVERMFFLRRIRRLETEMYPRLRDTLTYHQRSEFALLAESSAAPCAGVARAGLQNGDVGAARLKEAMEQEVSAQIARLQHNLSILATTASTAPYVGLLGTVLGILAAFGEIAATGQTGASVVAGGISDALNATALGLGVAIPAVMAYNYFSNRVNALSLEIETHALDLAARLAAEDAAPAPAPVSLGKREGVVGANRF